MKFDRIHHYF